METEEKTKITIEQILSWYPCESYNSADKIITVAGSEGPWTPVEIAEMDHIPAENRLWVLLRNEVLNANQLNMLACDFAEDVSHIFESEYPGDDCLRIAIETKRKWISGLTSVTKDNLAAANQAIWTAIRYTGPYKTRKYPSHTAALAVLILSDPGASPSASARWVASAAKIASRDAWDVSEAAVNASDKNITERQIKMIKKMLVGSK